LVHCQNTFVYLGRNLPSFFPNMPLGG